MMTWMSPAIPNNGHGTGTLSSRFAHLVEGMYRVHRCCSKPAQMQHVTNKFRKARVTKL